MSKREKLTKAQDELLRLLAVGPRTDITDDRTARALEGRDLAFHFYETNCKGSLDKVWVITPAGREALKEKANG